VENLTKQQIVLVTLLVSFVTSLATGIITVSLMEQEPQGVTQTINRIVERTIEKVVETPAKGAAVITKETVVVTSDDLTVKAVEKNSKVVVRIYKNFLGEDGLSVSRFIGVGVIVSSDGLIASEASVVSGEGAYIMVLSDKKGYGAKVLFTDDSGLAILKAEPAEGEKFSLPAAGLASSGEIKLGQSVIALSGEGNDRVLLGVISSLVPFRKDDLATTTSSFNRIETNIFGEGVVAGSPLLNLSGEVIGIAFSGNMRKGTADFLPATLLSAALRKLNSKQEQKSEQKPPAKPAI